ncbi:MAG: preprotein translocase subunit SecE [Lachnospiraceae bacterium]|nr:preprotein translocase subunit SecE [Lachnospiraceae bacterium]
MESNTAKKASQAAPKKTAKAKDKKAKESKLSAFFSGVKTEFKKIIWPTSKDTVKSSTAVVVVAIIMGIFIAMLDTAIKFGLGFLL